MKKIAFLSLGMIALGLAGCHHDLDSRELCVKNNGTWLESEGLCSFKEDANGARNTSYLIDDERVMLKNGIAENEIAPDSASKSVTEVWSDNTRGDFDGDGVEDVAVILTQNGGGSGTFFYVAVYNGTTGSNAIGFGDRVAPQTVEFREGEVIVNYADRLPWESMAARPSIAKSKYLKYENGKLKEVQKYPEITQNEAEALAIAKWGDCSESCEKMEVNRLDGNDSVWFVEGVYEGMHDDSVNALRYVAMANYIDGRWVLGNNLIEEHKCQEGRGQQEFGTDLCL